MTSYLQGVDRTIHPEDEMLLNAENGLSSRNLARAVYFRQGYEIFSTVNKLMEWALGEAGQKHAKVLDFACGYGRATRFLVKVVEPANLWVCDIYEGAVAFQKSQFGVNGFVSAASPADLKCDERFDFIYVASLFTHLPAAAFVGWLERLYELLAPGGTLVFSVHDETLSKEHVVPDQGFLFSPESESRSLDKEQYGATWVSERWMAQAIGRVVGGEARYKRLPLALCGSHDLYVLRRDPAEDFSSLSLPQLPIGYADWFSLTDDGVLRIGGWVAERDPAFEISSITVSLQGREVARIRPFFDRPDVAGLLGPTFLQSGWDFCVGSIDRATYGEQLLEVVVASTSGESALVHSSVVADAGAPTLPTPPIVLELPAEGEEPLFITREVLREWGVPV